MIPSDIARRIGSGTYAPGVNTSPMLRVYRFPTTFDPIEFARSHGYRVKRFCFEPEFFKVPNLKTDGYSAGTVWIYDPRADHGAFRDHEIGRDASIRYTFAWRVSHEVAHGQTEPNMQALYGDSRRDGRLGSPMIRMVGRPGKQVPVERRALTLAEAKRAVHWEVAAFNRQRDILADVGVTIDDVGFAREFNVNLQDAMIRILTGEFSNPGGDGFVPADTPASLDAAFDILESF